MTQWHTLNLNAIVRIKLTPIGEKVYHDYWAPHIDDPLEIVRRNMVDGWFECQLWTVALIFGAHMFNGCNPPIEMDIQVRL